MTIETLLDKGYFDDNEKSYILLILSNLVYLNSEITFIIDNSNTIAKFNSETSTITIPETNIYNAIIHELLHAELVYFFNYPQLKDINTLLFECKLIRFRKLIVDITNDIHHFLFYEKHKKMTMGKQNAHLINNQEQILNPKIGFSYLANKVTSNNDKFQMIKLFYSELYIPFKYSQLISNNNVNWNDDNLKKIDKKLFQIFNEFYSKILVMNLDIDFCKNKRSILKVYNRLFENLKKYIG